MKVLSNKTKFAHLGKPGSAFSNGFKRRLEIVADLIDLNNKRILDVGCGEGVWLPEFAKFTIPQNIFGSEFDQEQVNVLHSEGSISSQIGIPTENIVNCSGENLAFEDNSFDIVFQNEVLEHVSDDVATMSECLRVLKPGSSIILFTPNRGWPFETHGIFLGKTYLWGNVPFVPWLPKFLYKKLCPHVRNYSNRELRKVIKKAAEQALADYKVIHHKHVFPGFDGAVRRFGFLGKVIQKTFHFFEKTPLHFFGISHLIIIQKN